MHKSITGHVNQASSLKNSPYFSNTPFIRTLLKRGNYLLDVDKSLPTYFVSNSIFDWPSLSFPKITATQPVTLRHPIGISQQLLISETFIDFAKFCLFFLHFNLICSSNLATMCLDSKNNEQLHINFQPISGHFDRNSRLNSKMELLIKNCTYHLR